MAWPEDSRFFNPSTTNVSRISHLLKATTDYTQQHLRPNVSGLVMHNGRTLLCATATNARDVIAKIIDTVSPTGATTIIYMRQKRFWFPQRTTYAIGLDEETWMKLLERFEIPSNVVELIYENNGGNFCHASETETAETVFHVAYKIGGWGDHEHMAYARHELDSNNAFILVTGYVPNCLNKLHTLYEQAPQANIFHAMLELATSELDLVERMRWNWDSDTQDLEAKTGFSSLQVSGVIPLPVEQLASNKEGYVTLDGLRDIGWGSELVVATYRSLLTHLRRYTQLINSRPHVKVQPLHASVIERIRDVLRQRLSIAEIQHSQISQLGLRVRAQLDVTSTLITQRNMELNIEIANATKRDSEIMRGIAFVTMVFLPATFVATFFSMSSFGAEQSTLVMLPGIWVYPAVTLPLTAVIALWYFLSSRLQIQYAMGRMRRNSRPEGEVVINTRAAFIARQALKERLVSGTASDFQERPNQYGWIAE